MVFSFENPWIIFLAIPLSILVIFLHFKGFEKIFTRLFRYRNPWRKFLDIVKEVKKYGGVLTILWHHSVFNDLEFPGWADMYRRMIMYCKREGAWITSGYNILKSWEDRSNIDLKI